MASSIWEHCSLDQESLDFASKFNITSTNLASEPVAASTSSSASTGVKAKSEDLFTQTELNALERTCGEFLQTLDTSLRLISDIDKDYHDVTGRTNTLIQNCEDLLEQQHSLQTTVESLRVAFQPFNDIEAIGNQLGIPFDSISSKSSFQSFVTGSNNTVSSNTHLDPRSPEFHDILNKLATAILYIHEHQYYHDYEQYKKWLEQLQMRATSLIAKSMRELLESVSIVCKEIAMKQNMKKIKLNPIMEQPLESMPIYQKFRGLSYRMRELSSLLQWNRHIAQQVTYRSTNSLNPTGSNQTNHAMNILRKYEGFSSTNYKLSTKSVVEEIIENVQQIYVTIRCELAIPVIKEQIQHHLQTQQSGPQQTLVKRQGSDSSLKSIDSTTSSESMDKILSNENTPGSVGDSKHASKAKQTNPLSANIRSAYTTLIRIAQLEYQLFDSLFRKQSNATGGTPSTPTASGNHTPGSVSAFLSSDSPSISNDYHEVSSIIQSICNATNDSLRPLIIRESDLDELCKVVNILAEDLRSQILAASTLLPKQLLVYLIQSLDTSISDTQERLSFCAEIKLRQDIQSFEPLPSQLAYPDIIERSLQPSATTESSQVSSDDVSRSWYPTLKATLAMLSKLYGIIDMAIFEDFACRCLSACIVTLSNAATMIRKKSGQPLQGDLFLIRHLLILREQLVPFEIKLKSRHIEKKLDFRPTTIATKMLTSAITSRSFLRFDATNSFVQWARDGLPGVEEMTLDAKQELDIMLKNTCLSFKINGLKVLLGQLEGLVIKINAFVDESITTNNTNTANQPVYLGNDADDQQIPLLPSEIRAVLKQQAFMKPDRIKEILMQVQESVVHSTPDFRDTLKLYIENAVARTVLLKPIQAEIAIVKTKIETAIASCLDPGQNKRELDQLLKSIIATITSELTK